MCFEIRVAKDSPAANASLTEKFDLVAASKPPGPAESKSLALETPPARKGKPSPATGLKVGKPAPAPCDPLELQLQAMQKQLEEQGAQIAMYQGIRAKPSKPAPNPLELKLQAMQKQLEEQSRQLKAYQDAVEQAEHAAATPSPATKAAQHQQKQGSTAAQKPSKSPEPKETDAQCEDEDPDGTPIVMPDGTKVISHDALRMRLKRLCTKKASGKAWVDDKTVEEYKAGGAERETLELALLETIREVGSKATHAKMRVPRLRIHAGPQLAASCVISRTP